MAKDKIMKIARPIEKGEYRMKGRIRNKNGLKWNEKGIEVWWGEVDDVERGIPILDNLILDNTIKIFPTQICY